MKDITILKITGTHKVGALPRLFYNSKTEEHKHLLKGILTMGVSAEFLRKSEQVLIVDNPCNLSKEEFLKLFGITDSKDICMRVVHDYILNCGEFITFSDYELEQKNKHKAKLIKYKIRELIKDNKVLTDEQVNQLCEITNYPEGSNIDKTDFLEYYMFYCSNENLYEYYNQFKDPNIRWRDFKMPNSQNKNRVISLKNVPLEINRRLEDSGNKANDLEFKDSLRHTNANITKKYYAR